VTHPVYSDAKKKKYIHGIHLVQGFIPVSSTVVCINMDNFFLSCADVCFAVSITEGYNCRVSPACPSDRGSIK